MTIRRPIVRKRLAALIACSLTATIAPFSAATAEYGIPAGSGAVITAGAPLLVRATPGWDAEISYEIADGSVVTVWDAEQAAPDGSMWYPVDGGFVPVDAVTSVAAMDGRAASEDGVVRDRDAMPDAAMGASVDLGITDVATTDPWVDETAGKTVVGGDPAMGVAAPIASASTADTGSGGTGGEQIARFALQYQGYPYIYAGEGPYAFDCSGFTMFVIQNTLGTDIPHDMAVQYAMGQQVGRDALQPGDLVFFANTFRPGMSHNGVYIGGGQFVHAETESSGVTISDLDAEYYSARWYGAVRFS